MELNRKTYISHSYRYRYISDRYTNRIINAGGGRGGQGGFYSLTARAGTAYTITVELGDLDDSVLEIWKGPRNSPTLAAMNDDANGGLGSQVDWTPDSAGTYSIIVRGFSPSQRGRLRGWSPPAPAGS